MDTVGQYEHGERYYRERERRAGGVPCGVRGDLLGKASRLAHRPVDAVVSFYPSATYTSVKFNFDLAPKGGGKRGEVLSFSRASRMRLISKLEKVRVNASPCYFATFTFHDEPSEKYQVIFHRFFEALEDKGISAFYRVENQKRGVAHLHMIVWGLEKLGSDFIYDLIRLWLQASHQEKDEYAFKWHLGLLGNGNKCCVELIKSRNGMIYYVSKYIAKFDGNDEYRGRRWGTFGKVPIAPLVKFTLDYKQAIEFRRHQRSALRSELGKHHRTLSITHNRKLSYRVFRSSVDDLRFVYHILERDAGIPDPPENFPSGWWKNLDSSRSSDDFMLPFEVILC